MRAGLVKDAADYGFSGFGEACAGGSAARRGIARIEGKLVWSTKSHERYRARLCSRMGPEMKSPHGTERNEGVTGDRKMLRVPGAVVAEGAGLLSKIRAFSESWVVGSMGWVERFSVASGWLGYQKGRNPQLISPDTSGDLAEVAAIVKQYAKSPN